MHKAYIVVIGHYVELERGQLISMCGWGGYGVYVFFRILQKK